MALLHPTVKATTHKKKKGSIETKARCSLFFQFGSNAPT